MTKLEEFLVEQRRILTYSDYGRDIGKHFALLHLNIIEQLAAMISHSINCHSHCRNSEEDNGLYWCYWKSTQTPTEYSWCSGACSCDRLDKIDAIIEKETK